MEALVIWVCYRYCYVCIVTCFSEASNFNCDVPAVDELNGDKLVAGNCDLISGCSN
jgi:hypothetical protein